MVLEHLKEIRVPYCFPPRKAPQPKFARVLWCKLAEPIRFTTVVVVRVGSHHGVARSVCQQADSVDVLQESGRALFGTVDVVQDDGAQGGDRALQVVAVVLGVRVRPCLAAQTPLRAILRLDELESPPVHRVVA